MDYVKFILQQKNVDINVKNAQGNTPLIIATISCRLDVVKYLLSHKNIDINAINGGIKKWTALDYLSLKTDILSLKHLKKYMSDFQKIKQLLLEHGAKKSTIGLQLIHNPPLKPKE
jgi:ankyrin repeat protein